jgi:hypothetical protein
LHFQQGRGFGAEAAEFFFMNLVFSQRLLTHRVG